MLQTDWQLLFFLPTTAPGASVYLDRELWKLPYSEDVRGDFVLRLQYLATTARSDS